MNSRRARDVVLWSVVAVNLVALAAPTTRVRCGATWRTSRRRGGTPSASAARTNSRARTARASV